MDFWQKLRFKSKALAKNAININLFNFAQI